jgi:hypothetical protein
MPGIGAAVASLVGQAWLKKQKNFLRVELDMLFNSYLFMANSDAKLAVKLLCMFIEKNGIAAARIYVFKKT